MADDLIALTDHLQIERAVMGGTSMGAGVALNCALRYSQRVLGLILLRPAWLDCPNEMNAKLFGLIADMIRKHGPEAGLETFKRSDAYQSIAQECPDAALSLLGLFADQSTRENIARLQRIPQDAPNRDRTEWRRMGVPTLVMTTRGDPIHPFEYGQVLAKEIPGARFEELTAKSVDLAQYTSDLRRCLGEFLQNKFGRSESTGF